MARNSAHMVNSNHQIQSYSDLIKIALSNLLDNILEIISEGKSLLVKLDDYLDLFEKVIWKGKPDEKAMMLEALGGVPFASCFFVFFS